MAETIDTPAPSSSATHSGGIQNSALSPSGIESEASQNFALSSSTADFAASIALPSTRTLTVAEWIAAPGNAHQRDTDRHLQNAVHLRIPSPAHLQVNAAQLPDGSLIKLDGHTRARLWELQPDIAPEFVLAAIYPVASLEAAAALYHHFDNRAAVDTAIDDMSGAFRAAQFTPRSPHFRAYKGSYAIKIATARMLGTPGGTLSVDIYKALPKWLPELHALDSLGITPQRFSNPVLVAALLTIRRRGTAAVAVWDRYQQDLGTKDGKEMDGVEALTRSLINNKGMGGGYKPTERAAGIAVACVEAAIEGRLVSRVTPLSLIRYCAGMKREMAQFADLLPEWRDQKLMAKGERKALKKLLVDNAPLLH